MKKRIKFYLKKLNYLGLLPEAYAPFDPIIDDMI